MLRKALFVGLTLGCGHAGASAAFAAGPYFTPEPPTIPGQPFSAVAQTQSTAVFADGNRIVRNNTVHYYRDGQGRTRVERNSSAVGEASSGDKSGGVDMAAATIIEIEDPATGGLLTFNLQDVQETEPDPSLFTVPSNYTRRDLNMQLPSSGTATSTATITAVKKP